MMPKGRDPKPGPVQRIDVRELSPGVYRVNIRGGRSALTGRFIKQLPRGSRVE
jgi:hypothetical protein